MEIRPLVGDIIIANEAVSDFSGCIMQVDTVRRNGILASMTLPKNKGIVYVYLEDEQYEIISSGKE